MTPGDALYRILAVTDISQPQAPPKRLHTGGRILDISPAEDDLEARGGPGATADRSSRCLKFALCPLSSSEDVIVTAVELEELPFGIADLTRNGNVLLQVGHRVERSHDVLLLRPSNARLVPDGAAQACAEDVVEHLNLVAADDDDFLILDIDQDDPPPEHDRKAHHATTITAIDDHSQ